MPRTRDLLVRLASTLLPKRSSASSRSGAPTPPARPRPAAKADLSALPGIDTTYDPKPDGRPDPGEIVWTWVAYEDDPSQGKDRPVLIVGRRGAELVAVMMTSKDHDRDAADEARWGRYWMDIGSGTWDSRGRPSEVRLDRLIAVEEAAVRREGAVLDQLRYDEVVSGVRKHVVERGVNPSDRANR